MSGTQEVGEIFGAGSGPAHAMLRSPTVLIASIGLWGMNIYFFRVFGIDYVKVLNHDLVKMEEQDEPGNNSQHNRRKSKGVSRKDSENAENDSFNGEVSKSVVFETNTVLDDEEIAIMDSPRDDSYSDEITAGRLVSLSITLLILLHGTYSVWIDWLGGGSIGAIFAFYGAVTASILFPLQSTRWLRTSAFLVFQRSFELINPRCHNSLRTSNSGTDDVVLVKTPRPIPFIDVFFADAMCSMSKVFFDWGMLLNMAAYYPYPVPVSAWNILIPSAAAAVPFFIRARQCWVMWTITSLKNDRGRYQHLWNALKYSTSIFPLCLSAYQKTVMRDRAADLEVYLILLLIVNAAYALWWDVVMDWGMMKNPLVAASVICNPVSGLTNGNGSYSAVPGRDHMEHRAPLGRSASGSVAPAPLSCWYGLLRNRLRFGVAMSVLILFTDVILRFSWVLRFYHKLFPSGDSFVLCSQFLEVFRRALWNLLRVEWENLKQSGHHLSGNMKQAGHHPGPVKPPASIQLMLLNDDDKSSFLRGNASFSQLPNGRKITVEKNAEA